MRTSGVPTLRGGVFLAAAATMFVAGGLLLWRNGPTVFFADPLLAAIAWCF